MEVLLTEHAAINGIYISGKAVALDCTGKPSFTVLFEYTDTFEGEANYSWVNRENFTFPCGMSDLALLRKAKSWAGLSGIRCKRVNLGDLIALYPQGSCTVLFISTEY